MESISNKFSNIISKSNLPEDDKYGIITAFTGLSDKSMASLVELFEENSDNINIINENFKAKQAAFKSGDTKEWGNILKDECEKLSKE